MTKTFYKIKHLPSGLFWRPNPSPSKDNLSKEGKVYQRKPISHWLKSGGYTGVILSKYKRKFETFRPEEWRVVAFTISENEESLQ